MTFIYREDCRRAATNVDRVNRRKPMSEARRRAVSDGRKTERRLRVDYGLLRQAAVVQEATFVRGVAWSLRRRLLASKRPFDPCVIVFISGLRVQGTYISRRSQNDVRVLGAPDARYDGAIVQQVWSSALRRRRKKLNISLPVLR